MEPENDSNLTFDSINALMEYDPFADGASDEPPAKPPQQGSESEETPPAETQPGEAAPTETPPAEGTREGEPAPKETPPAAPAAQPDPVEELRTQNAELTKQLQTLTNLVNGIQTRQQPQQPQQPSGQPSPEQKLAAQYAFNVPDQIMAYLGSEELGERRTGLNSLLQGVAIAVHRQIMEEVTRREATIPNVIDSRIRAHGQQQDVFSDFYTTYPALNRTELRPLIVATAQAAAQESGSSGWTTQLRDETAKRVAATLGWSSPAGPNVAGQPNQQQPQQNQTPQRQPRTLGSGARPSGAGDTIDELAKDVQSTLFGSVH